MSQNDQIIIITVLVLLPLVPAFLLFKTLPSRAVVRGPLAGVNVALGGAFAGYVALTMFVATFWAHSIKPDAKTYRLWEVKGRMQLPDGSMPVNVRGMVGEPVVRPNGAGGFTALVPIAVGDENGAPDLILTADGYPPETIPLLTDPELGTPKYKKIINPKGPRIVIKDPIVFNKPARGQEYNPATAQHAAMITGGNQP